MLELIFQMVFLNKIIKLLSGSQDDKLDSDLTYNLIINNIAHLLTAILVLLFGIISLIKEQYVHSTILLIISIIAILSFYFLNRTNNTKVSSYVIVTIISLLLIYLMTNGLNGGNGALWFYLYPMLCLFLLGMRTGTIYFIIM